LEELGRTWNLEKTKVVEHNSAIAVYLISISLSDDDKGASGEYKLDIKEFWILLKVRYQKICQSTAFMYYDKNLNLYF
jgi:hypothetical protein